MVYNSKLKLLYTASLHNIKLFGYRIVEQSNYASKIVNVYIVYNLDAWQRNATNYFKFNNCLFGATSIVKNSDK